MIRSIHAIHSTTRHGHGVTADCRNRTYPGRVPITLTALNDVSPDPITALAQARALLDEVKAGRRAGVLRLYRPEPTAAFGARDRFLPGFPDAVAAARDHGFTPVLRSLGGRVAVYHRDSLVIDHLEPAAGLLSGTQERFTGFGDWYTAILRDLRVDARLGEIPGEYCPGEHSVNVAGRIKAIGTAQRVTHSGWLFSSSVVVADPDPIRAVLTDIQSALGVDWDPATGGAIAEVHPDITADAVEAAFRTAYAQRFTVEPGALTAAEVRAAEAYRDQHRL